MIKVSKSEDLTKNNRVLCRAIRIWNLVHIEGYSYTEAWKLGSPGTKAKRHQWCKLAKRDCRLFEKTYGVDLKEILDSVDLGLPRVVIEISKALKQKKVIMYKGEPVRDKDGNIFLVDDNVVQQRARELLIDLHGLRKRKMAHSVKSESSIQIGVIEQPNE